MTSLMRHAYGVNGQINRGWDMRRDIRPLPEATLDSAPHSDR